jgi:hypothetical protein
MKMDVQDSGQKGNDGGSEIDSPEPPDDSPVSLLNLVILARKIQCTSPQLLSNI